MAVHTVNIDVINKSIPEGNHEMIPVINQPNPCYGYAANANEVRQLIQLSNYKITEAGTNKPITGNNYYEYFPEEQPGGGGGGGGVTPAQVEAMIDASIDSTVSETSTKAVQNAAITNFVNSSIESSTAEFKGTYDSKAEMDEVTANQNDYAFLRVLNNDGSVNHYERYKWSNTEVSGSHWLFEYNVNNSSFTAEQWAAINSGIKDTDLSALGGHVNNTNNPHNVTKAQVGLSDVDNTSDADKPISTATQTALNTKFDTAGTGLNKNGTTVSHATPEGAATHAKAFYKFSTDALGHVNGVTEATEAEVNAIDSGITAAKVSQIETNKNNILNCIKVYPNIIPRGVNCNANSVEDNTLYRLQTDNVTNFPTGYPTTGALHYIVTIKNIYAQAIQRYQYIFNNEMKTKWRRSQNNGSWSAWSNVLSADTIECGSDKQYTRLRDAVAAGVLTGSTVIVYPGTYDLTSEFASELASETGLVGIALGNGVHVYFMAGSYVTAELDGSSDWAYENFQPFYTTGSFTLENAHIVAQNTRYCVHDEMGNRTAPYSTKYINCHMEYTNTRQNVKYVQCIGGGLGLHGNILIDGGFYKSSTEYGYSSYGSYGTAQNCQQPISYHNSSLASADSKIVIRNVYLADRGYFRFGNYGSSTMLSNIEISGCSVGLPTMNMFETVDDVTMNLAFVLYNNTIRNNAVPFDFSRIIGLYENGEYNESALLPSEYKQIAYLRSTGTQYIDTGIKPSGNDRISMTAQFTSINSSGSDTAFGARDSANVNAFVFGAVGERGGYFEIAYGTNGFTASGIMVSDTVRHNFAIDAGKGYVDTNVCNDYTSQTFDCNYNMFVFARNQAGSMMEGTGANLKVYGYRHYKNGALSAHLVPCRRKSDNVLGMYDLVNDVFLTNAGTGEFSAS